MYRKLLSTFSFSIALFAGAQSYVHQVLVLNEGVFNWQDQQQVVPVTLGSYDPANGTYSTVATIEGSRFGSDVLVHDQHIYVAADAKLLKFDLNSFALLDEVEVQGIRKIAVWNDRILITRGELGGLPHYFEVRNTADLALVDAITPAEGLPHSIEDVEVADGKAWLAVNNSFDWENITGYVAVVDLATMQLGTPIDLGPDGLNPEKIMVGDDAIHVLNNTDFTGSSISRISISGAALQFTGTIAENSGCGASAMAAEEQKIYFMEYAVNTLARYDTGTDAVIDTLNNGLSAYGLIDDPINNVMYVTTTDFLSSGQLHVMQYNGSTSGTVEVGVSPGHLALDVRSSTGISDRDGIELSLHPNPATEQITITGMEGDAALIDVIDALGRSVITSQERIAGGRITIDLNALEPGIHTVRMNGGAAARFMKL